MNRVLLMMSALAATSWASATYTFASNPYVTPTNYTTCATGPCANYSATGTITGSFTVASALGPNFSGVNDITSKVTSFSFSDGINTYSSSDSAVRVYQFFVSTDATGAISAASILIERWQTGTSPHKVSDRVASFNLNGPDVNQVFNNSVCTAVGGGTGSGVSDLCQSFNNDSSTSQASATFATWNGPSTTTTPPTPTPTPTAAVATPSLGEWGMIFLVVALVGFGWKKLNRAATQ